MSDETLLTAARRVVRFFNIDMNGHGGMISIDTQKAMETLDKQVRAADMPGAVQNDREIAQEQKK